MTWTTLTYAFGSKLTSTKMTQNQDNFAALAAKDAGAPVLANGYIVPAMITNIFGAWNIFTPGTGYNTNTLATKDCIVYFVCRGNTGSYWGAKAYTDSSATPTTLIDTVTVYVSTEWFEVSMAVRKGDYWRMDALTDATFNTADIKLLPIGT